MSTDNVMPRTAPFSVPPGWRVIYRVRWFCDADQPEPANEIGMNEYDTYSEALEVIRADRRKVLASRLEVLMLAPTVLPYPSVLKRGKEMLAEFYSQYSPPEPGYLTPMSRYG